MERTYEVSYYFEGFLLSKLPEQYVMLLCVKSESCF